MYGLVHFLKQYRYVWLQIAPLHDSCQLHFSGRDAIPGRILFENIFLAYRESKFPMTGKSKVNSTIYFSKAHTQFIALKLSRKMTLKIFGIYHPQAGWLSLCRLPALAEATYRDHYQSSCVVGVGVKKKILSHISREPIVKRFDLPLLLILFKIQN